MTLMMSTNNIFSPANGARSSARPKTSSWVAYYVTVQRPGEPGEYKKDSGNRDRRLLDSPNELFLAFSQKQGRRIHAKIKVRLPEGQAAEGRRGEGVQAGNGRQDDLSAESMFNDILPRKDAVLQHRAQGQKQIWERSFPTAIRFLGRAETIQALLDNMKELGFRESTRSRDSRSRPTTSRPRATKDQILAEAEKEVAKAAKLYQRGIITEQERYNKVLDFWTHARERSPPR